MTHPTLVGRGRPLARHALLALTTALSAGLCTPLYAGDVIPPHVNVVSPTGVSIADGTFTHTRTDLSIGTLQLEGYYSYTSSNPVQPVAAYPGNSFNIYVSPNWVAAVPNAYPQHYRPIVHMGLSASGEYRQNNNWTNPTISPNSDEANKADLSFSNGRYVYTDQSGTVYRFSATALVGQPAEHVQRIESITFPNGLVRSFTYATGATLKMVKDSSGYAIIFDQATGGAITAACGFNLSQIYVDATSTCNGASYKVIYGSSGSNATVTDAAGQTTTYVGNVCIKPPGYMTCKVDNVWSDLGLTQTLADGSTWQFRWGIPAIRDSEYIPTDGDNEVSVTDPKGVTTNYIFTGTTLVSATDANQHTTDYVYDGGWGYEQTLFAPHLSVGGMLKHATYPEGNAYHAEYNGPYKAISRESVTSKPGSGLAEEVVYYGYNCSSALPTPGCTKPNYKQDPRGNTTHVSYTAFGEADWSLLPPPIANAARALTLYDYVQKYAYVKNASGSLVSATTPVWLPATETRCQTVSGFGAGYPSARPTCDTTAPVTVTTYEYGANGTADNLLPRGKVVTADGQSLRTCYRYDTQANKIAETSPRAGLTTCS